MTTLPWHVDFEQFKALQNTVKPSPELLQTAKWLSVTFHKSSGHVEAKLYLDWAHKLGKKKATAAVKKLRETAS